MERILVGYDGSDPSDSALAAAGKLARALDAPLTILVAAADRLPGVEHGLAEPPDDSPGQRVAAAGALRAREMGVRQVEARTSLEAPDDALVLAAREGFTLVIVGHQSKGVLEEAVLGSAAKSVVDRSPCSVLVVR